MGGHLEGKVAIVNSGARPGARICYQNGREGASIIAGDLRGCGDASGARGWRHWHCSNA